MLNRCLALGYEKADCRKILKHKSVNNESQFSERGRRRFVSVLFPQYNGVTHSTSSHIAWEKILSTIHPILEERKATRLAAERTRRKKARLQVIREEYAGLFKIMLPGPVDLACLPFHSEIAQFPELQSHAEQDEEVTPDFRLSVKRVLDDLQPKLWTLSKQRLSAVVSLVPTFSDQPKCASLSQNYISMTSSPLDLATSVFACACSLELPQDSHLDGTPIQLGLNALGHVCPDSVRYPGGEFSGTCLPTFSPKGREVVVMILRDLGLDEPHTTIADLDELDPRFVCLSCPIGRVHDRRRRKSKKIGCYSTFTWRALVSPTAWFPCVGTLQLNLTLSLLLDQPSSVYANCPTANRLGTPRPPSSIQGSFWLQRCDCKTIRRGSSSAREISFVGMLPLRRFPLRRLDDDP